SDSFEPVREFRNARTVASGLLAMTFFVRNAAAPPPVYSDTGRRDPSPARNAWPVERVGLARITNGVSDEHATVCVSRNSFERCRPRARARTSSNRGAG